MLNEPQSSPAFDPVTHEPLPPRKIVTKRKLLAPVWHTCLMVVLVLGNSALSAWVASRVVSGPVHLSEADRITQYVATLGLEFFLLFVVWVGLRLNGIKIRELIGGRWDSVEAFLRDVALAIAFCICAFIVTGGLSYALGLSKPAQVDQAKKVASMLAPHTWRALLIFILLSSVAGFVEEIIFRGYLQRQFTQLSGKTYVGLILSALIFGAAHGYEGVRRMLVIFILGMMFGLLVLWRKNLRSAMMGHALFDSAQGIILFVATRIGLLS